MASASQSQNTSKHDDATRTREVYPASPPNELNVITSNHSRQISIQNSTGRTAGGILDSGKL